LLWPGLPVEEGRARVGAAITGAAEIETWQRIKEIAATEPDLFTHRFAALRELRAEREAIVGFEFEQRSADETARP
jgi:hypothetical protein